MVEAKIVQLEPLYMSVKAACERYSLGRNSIYELFQVKGCPAIKKYGCKVLIPVREFDEFFESQLETAANYHG